MANSLSFEDLCQTGRGHLKAGRLDEALAALQEAERLNELDADVHEGLAYDPFSEECLRRGGQAFRAGDALDPRRGNAWINLGAVYNRMGNYQKASEVLRRAVQIEKKSSAGTTTWGLPTSI